MQVSDEERFKDLLNKAEFVPRVDDKVFKAIVDQDHTYIDWETKLDLLMKKQHTQTGKCNFALAKQPIFTDNTAFAFQKGFPWLHHFNRV